MNFNELGKRFLARVIAIVQARMGSTRLPGKVLLPLNGYPSIVQVMRRIQACNTLDEVYLATSVNTENDVLSDLSEKYSWAFHRGSEDDVLSRFIEVLQYDSADIVVRVNADNMAIDPEVIRHTIKKLESDRLDVCSPFLNNSYPFGAGAEVSTGECLLRLDSDTLGADSRHKYREHIYFYAYDNRDKYRVGTIKAPSGLDRPDINISVDTPESFHTMEKLYGKLSTNDDMFSLGELIQAWDDLQS